MNKERNDMTISDLHIPEADARRLLGAANGDALLLYIYIRCGNDPATAASALRLTEQRCSCAAATLRQLGMWPEEKRLTIAAGERPNYTERDVLDTLDREPSFRSLYGEIQRRLGKPLNTEELKILLSFVRYLGLPEEVICVLVSYCQERARRKGSLRNPSLRTIEKEAYAWAERGIDTMEEAAAFIQAQNVYHSRLSGLMRILQIRGRSLTAAEEKYARAWLDMDLEDELIAMAYERTCLNTGGLSWAYMNKILLRWKQSGFRTAEDVRRGDRKNAPAERRPDADEQAAIRRMLQEG
ncbi:MAG: DnaD domain protein [Ruminococcaceae bacterium]|nr:DnaD domain protein [Oscillospiraceae bacterium]